MEEIEAMKMRKFLISGIALMALSSVVAFADGATIVDTAITDTDDAAYNELNINNTYAGDESDEAFGEIPGNGLSSTNHSLNLLADVATINLVPTLYYNAVNVESDAALYDADWNLNTGFTSKSFSIGLTGTTSASEYLRVTVAATPFVLYDDDDTTMKDQAGAMTVAIADSIGTEVSGSEATSTDVSDPTSYTIQSTELTDAVAYESITPLVAFTLTTAAHSDTLLAGRYQSTVTLTYAMV